LILGHASITTTNALNPVSTVKVLDPLVFAAIPIVLTFIALLAVWFPALRASRLNPIEALRYE